MEKIITTTKQDLKDALREALEDAGLATPEIGRAEIVKLVGRHRYDKAVKAGYLQRKKAEGQPSKVRILRRDFIQLLKDNKI